MLDNLHVRVFMAKWNNITPSEWVYQNLQDFFWRLYLNKTDGAYIKLAVPDSPASESEIYPLEGGKAYFIPAGVRFSTGIDCNVDVVGEF